jgi:hypothetical protein
MHDNHCHAPVTLTRLSPMPENVKRKQRMARATPILQGYTMILQVLRILAIDWELSFVRFDAPLAAACIEPVAAQYRVE